MSLVRVAGSGRLGAGVPATVARVREALALVAASDGDEQGGQDAAGPRVIVDPAAWFAEQDVAPGSRALAGSVGLSLAPCPSPLLDDDARLGEHLAAIVHIDADAAKTLRERGCRASHVPLGCRPALGDPGPDRPLHLVSLGPSTPYRLWRLATGAAWFDELRCAHLFDEEIPCDDGEHPFSRARVLLDLAGDEGEPVDLVLLLTAIEAGLAVVTERSAAQLPGHVARAALSAPGTELFGTAHELATDGGQARERAALARAAWEEGFSLQRMGFSLAQLATGATVRRAKATDGGVALQGGWAPPTPPTVVQRLHEERARPDSPVREGLRQVLGRLRTVEQRITALENGGVSHAVEVLAEPSDRDGVAVSVLVPVYRGGDMLLEALESVRATAAEDDAPVVEAVVVDDASPLDDGAAVAEWSREHPELAVTVLRHATNRGLAGARNTALAHAAGELVLPLDADNRLRRGGVRRLLDALRAHPRATFAYGILQEFDVTGPVGLRGLFGWDPARLRHGNYVDALALVRRDDLVALGGYAADMPEPGFEDWDLWCRFAAQGAEGRWVPEIVASYRVRPGSMSDALHLSQVASLADMLERHPALLG